MLQLFLLTILATTAAAQNDLTPEPPLAAQPDDWGALIAKAETLQSEGRLAEAKRVLLTAQRVASTPHRLACTLHTLGSVAQDEGRSFEAEKNYRRALDFWQAAGERSRPGAARTLNNLASTLFDSGKWNKSLELLRRSEEIEVQGGSPVDADVAVIISNRATIYLNQRKYQEAEKAYRRAGMMLVTQGEAGERPLANIELALAFICRKTGRNQDALAHAAMARNLLQKHLDAGHDSADILMNLAVAFSTLGDQARAKELTQRGLSAAERRFGPEHPVVADILSFQAELLRKANQKQAAKETEARARAIRANSHSHLDYSISITALAQEAGDK